MSDVAPGPLFLFISGKFLCVIIYFIISRVSHGLDDLFEQTMYKERVNLVRKRQVVLPDTVLA